MILRITAILLALLAGAGVAEAGTMKLKDLLGQGYVIVGTAVAPSSVTSTSLNTPNEPDELVVTLVRAGNIAFCHFIFGATYSNETIPDADCFAPGTESPQAAQPSQETPAPQPQPDTSSTPAPESAPSSAAPLNG